MNIVVLTENRKIEYLDLPSGTDAEEFVADRYSLLEIEWGVYEEEEVVYNDCQLCIDGVHINETTIDNIIKQDNLMTHMEQTSKQMEQDGF